MLAGHPVILCDNPINRDSKSWAPGAQLQLLFAVCLTENQVTPGPQAPHLSNGAERENSDTNLAPEVPKPGWGICTLKPRRPSQPQPPEGSSASCLRLLCGVALPPSCQVLLPCWLSGKDSACQCRRRKRCTFNPWVCKRCTFDPWSGRSSGGGHGNPLQYSCLENPMDRGAWWATVHGVAVSDITE